MADPINDTFGKNDGLDPFGPYSRQSDQITDVKGVKVATREIHVEQMIQNGTRQVFVHQQYLCQSCGNAYVTLGQTGSIVDNNILCNRCALRSKIIWVLTPLWSPFVKKPESK
jgi:hypothetical protein